MTAEAKIDEKVKINVDPPRMWKVIFLNDDKTPMEFVIELLITIFRHDESSAKDITMEIHNTGSGVAGIYSFEVAEQRGIQATQQSRQNGFPLKVQIVEEE